MTIGKRIGRLRKAKGYTQEYVAEQLGVSRQAVSKWEQDQTSPDTKNLIALAKVLETTVVENGRVNDPPIYITSPPQWLLSNFSPGRR